VWESWPKRSQEAAIAWHIAQGDKCPYCGSFHSWGENNDPNEWEWYLEACAVAAKRKEGESRIEDQEQGITYARVRRVQKKQKEER